MSTDNTRTASPWHLGVRQAGVIIYDARGWAVANCVVYHGEHQHGEAKANAAFIVKACNAHDELVAALREIATARETSSPQPALSQVLLRCEKVALAALAKVTP